MLAKRLWQRKQGNEVQIAHLSLIVEVKSIRGYHLVFAPSSFSPSYAPAVREWTGYASERGTTQARLTEALVRADLQATSISRIIDRLFEQAYPEGTMVVKDLVVNPPPAPFAASAFRETNVGGHKDLSASVFWKAIQMLSAFKVHARSSYLDGSFRSLELMSDYARLRDLGVVEMMVDELAEMSRRVLLFHPVVVVDAALWALKDGDLAELPWCRFHRLDKDGLLSAWYDVVQSSSLADYLQHTTDHYDRSMDEVGAK